MGVKYVLVHEINSQEFYHDFKNTHKWESVGKKIWSENGDAIYEIEDVSLAWEVDLDKIKKTNLPLNGEDISSLELYLSSFISPVKTESNSRGLKIYSNNRIDSILLINSFSASINTDRYILIYKDNFMNTLISTNNKKLIELEY